MRLIRGFVVAPTLVLFVSALVPAQGQEASRSVAGGGVSVVRNSFPIFLSGNPMFRREQSHNIDSR